MNKKYIVSLDSEEQSMLKELISKRSKKSSVVLNAQILLGADTNGLNYGDAEIGRTYHVSPVTIQRIREKFVLHGMETALKGLKRGPQNPSIKIDGDLEARIVQLACSKAPEGYNRWTLRLLADRIVELKYVDSLSHEGVRQVLKKTKLSLGGTTCG
jgi:hypothetical protein